MGQLNLGINGKIQATNIDLSAAWSNAPSGTVITTATGDLGTAYSTSNDTQQDTGLHTSALVRKLPGGTTAGTSKIIVTCTGGCRDSDSSSGQSVTVLYKSTNGGSDSERDYMDSVYGTGSTWLPHSSMHIDTSADSAGASLVYKMYQRSRGGGITVHFNKVIGGVTGSVYLIAQEVVN